MHNNNTQQRLTSPKHRHRPKHEHQHIQPHRHTIQVPKMSSPKHAININSPNRNRFTHVIDTCYQESGLDVSLPQQIGGVFDAAGYRKARKPYKQFATNTHTPRMTVMSNMPHAHHHNHNHKRKQIVVVPSRSTLQNIQHPYQNEQYQQKSYNNDYDQKVIQNVSILSKQYQSPSKRKYLGSASYIDTQQNNNNNNKLQRYNNIRQPIIKPQSVPINIDNINYVASQRHSHKHKRSQLGPVRNNGLEKHRHRRLATTVEQYDDQYSKTQTEEEGGEIQHQHQNCQQCQQQEELYYQDQEYCQECDNYQHQHEQQYHQGQRNTHQNNTNIGQNIGSPKKNPFLKQKQTESKKSLQQQIEARFKDIEDIMSVQNQNLKQHNQYLLAVIKKMQTKDRKQRTLIQKYMTDAKRLSEQRDAYMQRCLYLQGALGRQLAKQQQDPNQDDRQQTIQKHCSVLNLENMGGNADQGMTGNAHVSSAASDINNQTMQFVNRNMNMNIAIDQDRDKKVDRFGQQLKGKISQSNTITQSKSANIRRQPSPIDPQIQQQYNQISNKINKIYDHQQQQQHLPLSRNPPTQTPPISYSQLQPYIMNQQQQNSQGKANLSMNTPQFYSNNNSPQKQRRPRMTAKISQSSNQSDPSSTIFHDNDSSGIMNNSQSFGGAGWVNTNSGFSVVKGLQGEIQGHHIHAVQRGRRIHTLGKQDTSDVNEQQQQQQDNSSVTQQQIDQDNQITKNNSRHQTHIQQQPSQTADEQAVQQLNQQFQQLMREYHISHDVTIRKQCVQLAKKIKELKLEVQKNRELQEQLAMNNNYNHRANYPVSLNTATSLGQQNQINNPQSPSQSNLLNQYQHSHQNQQIQTDTLPNLIIQLPTSETTIPLHKTRVEQQNGNRNNNNNKDRNPEHMLAYHNQRGGYAENVQQKQSEDLENKVYKARSN